MHKLLFSVLLSAAAITAADPPQAEISNGVVRATLYLPDAEQGYYRATRFDWAGVIASLEYKGHNYFGQWFPRYDPKLHDSIMGPVDSFGVLWYDAVPVDGTFVRIGVGTLKKPQEARVNDFRTYDIVDGGKWSVKRAADSVEFTHELAGVYTYRKTVRLTPGKPEMVLEYSLRNTGAKTIETDVFNHNFFMLDKLPTGPDVVVTFPFEVHATRPMTPLADVSGKELTYLAELQTGQTAQSDLTGFGATAADFDFRVENRKTGTAVRQRGSRPITRINFWSVRTTVCPEAYNHISVAPGQETTWRLTYEFSGK
jgi:hypothetical protein